MPPMKVWCYDPQTAGNHWWLIAECQARQYAALVASALLTSPAIQLGATHLEVWDDEREPPRLMDVYDATTTDMYPARLRPGPYEPLREGALTDGP